jgi:predicted ATPase
MLHGISPEPFIKCIRSAKYCKVFYLDPLDKYVADYARIESSDERDQLARLLWKAYSELEFCIDRVPVLPKLERIDYILARAS